MSDPTTTLPPGWQRIPRGPLGKRNVEVSGAAAPHQSTDITAADFVAEFAAAERRGIERAAALVERVRLVGAAQLAAAIRALPIPEDKA